MQNLALARETVVPCQEIDIVSTGVESMAVAALLSSRGRGVRFTHEHMSVPEHLSILGGSVNYKSGRLSNDKEDLSAADLSYRGADLMLVCARAGDYRQALHTVAELLYPGQTVFVVDAPFGTVFELSHMVFKLRKRMAVNILEMGPLFDKCKLSAGSLEISGLKDQVPICGRSVNETRCGLAVGRQLFSGLLPASNVLERGLCDPDSIVRIAQRLAHVNLLKGGAGARADTSGGDAMLADLEAEIQELGKVYNVHVSYCPLRHWQFSDNLEHEKQELEREVCEALVLLSDLAGVAYLSVPALDSIIEVASLVLSRDLRNQGRKLSDLGLSGMCVRDIIELVNS